MCFNGNDIYKVYFSAAISKIYAQSTPVNRGLILHMNQKYANDVIKN